MKNCFNDRTKLAMKLARVAGKKLKNILHKDNLNTKQKGINDIHFSPLNRFLFQETFILLH